MSTTFSDRWGVPVLGTDGAAVAVLDQAIEDLVALTEHGHEVYSGLPKELVVVD